MDRPLPMGFDGIPRLFPHSDALNPYRADAAARKASAGRKKVSEAEKDEEVIPTHHDLPQYDEESEKKQAPFNEEELEQIMIFARVRGVMNLALETGENYNFQINPETGLVELIEERTGNILLTITAEELMGLTGKVHRYAGILTDRAG